MRVAPCSGKDNKRATGYFNWTVWTWTDELGWVMEMPAGVANLDITSGLSRDVHFFACSHHGNILELDFFWCWHHGSIVELHIHPRCGVLSSLLCIMHYPACVPKLYILFEESLRTKTLRKKRGLLSPVNIVEQIFCAGKPRNVTYHWLVTCFTWTAFRYIVNIPVTTIYHVLNILPVMLSIQIILGTCVMIYWPRISVGKARCFAYTCMYMHNAYRLGYC